MAPPRTIWIIATVKLLVSAAFLYVGLSDNLVPGLAYLVLLGLGAVYYYYRQRFLVRQGISLDALLRREVDEAAATARPAP